MNRIIRLGTLGLAGSVGVGALAVGGYGLAANAGDDAFKNREDNVTELVSVDDEDDDTIDKAGKASRASRAASRAGTGVSRDRDDSSGGTRSRNVNQADTRSPNRNQAPPAPVRDDSRDASNQASLDWSDASNSGSSNG